MSSIDDTFKQKYINLLKLPISIQSYLYDTVLNCPLIGNTLCVGNTLYVQDNIYMGIVKTDQVFLNSNYCLTNNLNVYGDLKTSTLISKNTTTISIFTNTGTVNNLYSPILSASNNLNSYSANTINLIVSATTIMDKCTVLNTLTNINNANINNSTIIYSNFFVSSNSIHKNNVTLMGILNVRTNLISNNFFSCSSEIYNIGTCLTTNNLTVLSNMKINNNFIANTVVANNIVVENNIYVSGLFTANKLNTNKISLSRLRDYPDNTTAAINGIPLWGFYRTGGILKVRLDISPPTLQLTGNNVIITQAENYTELGVFVTDNLDTVTPYISAIYYNSLNYINIDTKIYFTTSTWITNFNSLLVGDHTILYSAIDNYDNLSIITRSVKVLENPNPPIVTITGNNPYIIKLDDTYIEFGAIISSPINETLPLNIINPVNTSTIGEYIVEYTAIGSNLVTSNSQYRTVYVLNTETFSSVDLSTNGLNFLYITNNYNSITTSQYWTFEAWIYITTYANGCTILDFNEQPSVDISKKFRIIINIDGCLGVFIGSNNSEISISRPRITLNKWSHVVCQRDGMYIEFYLDGSYVGNIETNTFFDNLGSLNQLTLGMSNSISPTILTDHLIGQISHAKLSLGLQYLTSFIPSNNLLSQNSNVLFCLGDNYTDIISGRQMTFRITPTVLSRENFITLQSTGINTRSLIFDMKVSDLPLDNIPWIANNNSNYKFILHPNANAYSTIIKVQNGNGWERTGNAAWILDTNSYSNLTSLNWYYGLTLEQWIFVDYDFIPPTTPYLICGQSDVITGAYGFVLYQSQFPYSNYGGNFITVMIGSNVIKHNNAIINLNSIRGKWSHLALVVGTSTSTPYNNLQVYINGALTFNTLLSTLASGSIPIISSAVNFTIGCNSDGSIQPDILSKLHYGNTRLYNRMLVQYEIINNYNYELNKYVNPTRDILISPTINLTPSLTSTVYDTTNGVLSLSIDLNMLLSLAEWCFEVWVYSTSWDGGNKRIFDLGSGTSVIYFGVTNDVTLISSGLSNDAFGRPCMFNSNASSQVIINNSRLISLNRWTHVVFQKNAINRVEMFVNGVSTGTFNINSYGWGANFSPTGVNLLTIGGDRTIPNSSTNHWLGKISQPKITLYRKYIGNFTPSFDLSLNENGIFLLQDNFINAATNKYLTSNAVTIPTYSKPTFILLGDTKILYNTVWTDLGVIVDYYMRMNFNIIASGTVDTSTIGKYEINYYFVDNYNNINYTTKIISVVSNLIPPTITLNNGSTILYVEINTPFIDPGYTVTTVTGETIIPTISGSVDTTKLGTYTLTYTVIDSSDNITTATRIVAVIMYKNAYLLSQRLAPLQNKFPYWYVTDGRQFFSNTDIYNYMKNNDFTVELWFKILPNTTDVDVFPLWGLRQMTDPLGYPTLSLGLIQKAKRMVELVIFATNWKTNGDIFFNPPRNLWCHIATTYVQSTNTLSVWINGMVAINAVVAPTRIFVASNTTDFKFYIGSGYLDSFRSWDGFFPGYIFQPLISNYIKYTQGINFIPSMDLDPLNYSQTSLYLGDNYIDKASGQVIQVYDNSNMPLSVQVIRQNITKTSLVYSFPGGSLDNNFWALHNNTIGKPWVFTPSYTPYNYSNIDFSQGFTITFIRGTIGSETIGPSAMIYIGTNPQETVLDNFTSSSLTETSGKDPIYTNYIALRISGNLNTIELIYNGYLLRDTNNNTRLFTVQDNSCIHIGLVFNPNNNFYVYENGILVHTFTNSSTNSAIVFKNSIFNNGIWFGTGQGKFNNIHYSDIHIYNYALSRSQLYD